MSGEDQPGDPTAHLGPSLEEMGRAMHAALSAFVVAALPALDAFRRSLTKEQLDRLQRDQ